MPTTLAITPNVHSNHCPGLEEAPTTPGFLISDRRQSLLTILLLVGVAAILVTWVGEVWTGLLSDYDRYANLFLLASLLLGLSAPFAAPQRQQILETVSYFGIALYFIGSLFFLAVFYDEYSIYNLVNTLQWMPVIYIASFIFFGSRRAIWAGAAVLVAALIPPVLITAMNGTGYWNTQVLSLLLNSYIIQFVTLLAATLVAFLQEQYVAVALFGRRMEERVQEREAALAAVQRETRERLRLEEQLRQSQKMEAVGQLTGGVAHDFNNLLTVILGNAELLAEELTDRHHKAMAQTALEAAEQGAKLTQQLLAFARRQSLNVEPLVLDEVVRGMMNLLKRTLGEDIEIRTSTRETHSIALTDRALLESAILNLVVNARDAMRQGGVLTIATGERAADACDDGAESGQEVVFVTVSDTGTGMPPEVLERAFEPFFTTKEVGKGSGLGLSMVYGFAQQSGGHVGIESQPGRGTAVTIVLPAFRSQAAGTAPEEDAPVSARGEERVLVVEDEPQVMHFVSDQLRRLGYRVTAVPAGAEALLLLQNPGNFDLLFTDVVLPNGMSGVELAGRARALKPGLKVLLTSGYPKEVFAHHGHLEESSFLLRKPYKRKELARVLREVLDSPPA